MIPMIQKEIVDNRKWISDSDLLEIVALSETTPGPVAINAATFVGFKVAGYMGAILATIGVVFPSFFIIVIISGILQMFKDNRILQAAFMGIRAGVLALIIKALYSMYKKCPHNAISYVIMATSFVAVAVFNVNVIWVLIGCAVLGLVSSYIMKDASDK